MRVGRHRNPAGTTGAGDAAEEPDMALGTARAAEKGTRGMSRNQGRSLAATVFAFILASGVAAADEDLERALSLAAEQRHAEAGELLGSFLQGNPGHPQGRLLHGVLNARTGRVSEAIDIFEALLEDHPDMYEPYNNLAVLYAVQGRLDEARETLLAALERRPTAVGYENLGDIHADLARRAYLQARSLRAADGEGLAETPAGASEAAAGAEREGEDRVLTLRESAGAEDAAPRSGICARAEGFEDLDAVAGAVQWLRARGAEIVAVRLEEDRSIKSYRVYLPPFPSRAKAAETVREIQERGVRDVAVIGEGVLKNGVSFGVYRDEENMRRRVAALEALGYSPRSAPDAEVDDDYVVEVHAPAAFDADWKERFPEQSLRAVDCRGLDASR